MITIMNFDMPPANLVNVSVFGNVILSVDAIEQKSNSNI